MKLNNTRKIIALILELVMAIGTITFLISVTMTFTTADKNYFINHFATQELAEECNNQLNLKYEALSHESSIPARVFERVEQDFPTTEALRQAALSVFSEENETLYSQNKIDYFYELCCEYLDGNDISYKKSDIKIAAEKAARIYSDTVGLHNTGGIKERLSHLSTVFSQATIISFLVVFACFPVIMVMFKRKKSGYFFSLGGILSGSAATALGSLMLVAFNYGSKINIQPEIYKHAVLSTARRDFLILAFLSVVLAAGAYSVMSVINKKIQDED